MSISNPWDDDFEAKINLDDAKFIFQQAEIKLKDTIEASQIIVARTTIIASVSIGIMCAIVGYLFTIYYGKDVANSLIIFLKIAAIYFFIINIVMIVNLQPMQYAILGTKPSKLYIGHFFESQFDNTVQNTTTRLLEFYKVTIIGYEKCINDNEEINKKRWRLFRLSVWLLTLSPLSIIGLYILFTIFFR